MMKRKGSGANEFCTVAETLGVARRARTRHTEARVSDKRARDDTSSDMHPPVSSLSIVCDQDKAVSSPQARKQSCATPAVSRAPRLTQTFLDFGQSALHRDHTCPRCGMLYTALEEDAAVHRQFCDGVRRAVRRGSLDAWQHVLLAQEVSTRGEREAFVQSPAAVRTLELLLDKLQQRRKELYGEAYVSCSKVQDGHHTSDARSFYVFRCVRGQQQPRRLSSAFANVQRQVWLWLQLFHLVCADDMSPREATAHDGQCGAASEVIVVVVAVQERLRRVLCGVAGCARKRAQHSVEPIRQCSLNEACDARRGAHTLCDVQAIWLPPDCPCADVEMSGKISCIDQATQQSMSRCAAMSDALHQTLHTLARHVVYGQQLHLRLQFSYSSALFNESGGLARHCGETSAMSLLCRSVAAEGAADGRDAHESHTALFIHDVSHE